MKKIISVIIVLFSWHLFVLLPVFFPVQKNVGEFKIYDRYDQLITHLPSPNGLQIPLGDDEPIPENIAAAFISVEDERFHSHMGIDTFAKIRAFRDNVSAQRVVSGGSTITEQYLKNKYFPHASRTILQKIREANLAFYSSLFVSKEDILRAYLDNIYFGHRNYGIKAAMKSYFDKSHLETLTSSEVVTLLAIIRSPGVIKTNEKYFQDRFDQIASVIYLGGKETNPRLRELDSTPIEDEVSLPPLDVPYRPQPTPLSIPKMTLSTFQGTNKFPHVTATLRQLSSDESTSITIHSTVDSALQSKVKDLINLSLDRLADKHVTNGAAYILQPSTGDILAWQGSKDFHASDIDGQVNVITQRRQMGSALKPFLYLFAFMQGAHPDQLIVDLEKDFQTSRSDENYRPLNYGLREGGVMPLKIALANSFNIASVRLLEHLGLQPIYDFLSSLGLPFQYPAEHYGFSLALGSPDLPMRSVADAYATLANNGIPITSHLISQPSPRSPQSSRFSQSSPYFHLFQTLSNPLNRRRSFGVNSVLSTTIPFAVKTGTTKNFHDNWTFGYHPDLVVATWVGNNDNSPMIDVDGITGAGPIWNRSVEAAIDLGYVSQAGKVVKPFLREMNLVQTEKCLNASCSHSDLIYQNPDQEWYSLLEEGHFCLEDFFIQGIDTTEITKIAKLFDFKDFSIERCRESGVRGLEKEQKKSELSGSSSEFPTPSSQLQIFKPQPNETFYLQSGVPLELQEIILKSNQDVEWTLNQVGVGYGKIIFIQPTLGKHTLQAKKGEFVEKRSFTVKAE